MTINLESLTQDLTELRLKHFEKACRDDLAALTPVERDRMTALMARWIRKELSERKSAAIQNRVRNAKFVKVQTIDAFKFDHSPMTKKVRTNYLALYDSIDAEDLPSAVFIALGAMLAT